MAAGQPHFSSTTSSSTSSTPRPAAPFFRSLPWRRRLLASTSILPVQLLTTRPPSTTLINPSSSRCFSSFNHCHRSSVRSHCYSQIRAKLKSQLAIVAAAVAVFFLAVVVLGNFETVPYSSRRHLILLTSGMERAIGDFALAKNENDVLPWDDPKSVKVRMIARKILKAVEEELKRGSEGEIMGRDAMIKHLEAIKWEVIVVWDWRVNAFCLPGGKIVVNSGLLDQFEREDEIATVIGHEVPFVYFFKNISIKTKKIDGDMNSFA